MRTGRADTSVRLRARSGSWKSGTWGCLPRVFIVQFARAVRHRPTMASTRMLLIMAATATTAAGTSASTSSQGRRPCSARTRPRLALQVFSDDEYSLGNVTGQPSWLRSIFRVRLTCRTHFVPWCTLRCPKCKDGMQTNVRSSATACVCRTHARHRWRVQGRTVPGVHAARRPCAALRNKCPRGAEHVRTDGAWAREGEATEPARQRRRQCVGKCMGNAQKACLAGSASVAGFTIAHPAILLSVRGPVSAVPRHVPARQRKSLLQMNEPPPRSDSLAKIGGHLS